MRNGQVVQPKNRNHNQSSMGGSNKQRDVAPYPTSQNDQLIQPKNINQQQSSMGGSKKNRPLILFLYHKLVKLSCQTTEISPRVLWEAATNNRLLLLLLHH